MKQGVIATFFLILFAPMALAQQSSMPSTQMGDMNMQPKGDTGPASQAFGAAMTKMDEGMNITHTGDADRDFVAGMIPHHQGAIDMAKVELQYGEDASLRKLARNIVAAQQREIAMMKKWQERHVK
jgi:uncharacterized protein (DUF305 family)